MKTMSLSESPSPSGALRQMHGVGQLDFALDLLDVGEVGHEDVTHRLRDDLAGRCEEEQQRGRHEDETRDHAST